MHAIPTFPARPINGGPLELARAKRGIHHYEPKFNGWRALVHTPTGTMFNRHGALLTIAHEFRAALDALIGCGLEWLDCEALERRHKLGQGSLVALDYIPPTLKTACAKFTYYCVPQHYAARRATLLEKLAPIAAAYDFEHDLPPKESVLLISHTYTDSDNANTPSIGWKRLQHINTELGTQFFEGFVAKSELSPYPVQLRDSKQEYPGWMKHRWEF